MLLKKINLLVLLACCSFAAGAQQVVKATNVNMVTTPGTRLVINGGITFTGTTTLRDSGQIDLLLNTTGGRENWMDSTAAGVYTSNSNGKVVFASDSLQYIYGNTQFYDMRVFNDSSVFLNSNIEVRNQLDIDKGKIYTIPLTTTMYVSNPATTSVASTNNFTTSWVQGRLERAANVTSPFYLFPIGKDTLYAPVRITKFNTNTARYVAEYFPAVPYDRTNFMNPPIDHVSNLEYWEINSNIASGQDDDARVSLSWRGYSMVSSSSIVRDSLLVTQYINTPRWDVPGGWVTGNASGPDSLFGYVISRTWIGSFSYAERRFTLGSFSKYNLLPIKLVSFTAAADGNRVRLNWDIRNDQDVVRYEIEKSGTPGNFSYLTTIYSLQRAQWQYSAFDNNPVIGWNYYRLKIIDKSGHVTYSEIRKVKFNQGMQEVKIFPNPTTDVLNVQLPTSYAKVVLQLYASDGRLIFARQPSGNNIQLNVSSLPAGAYILRIITGDNTESHPFIKQ